MNLETFLFVFFVLFLGTQGVYVKTENGEYGKAMYMSTYISKRGIPATSKMIANDNMVIQCTQAPFTGSYGVPKSEKLKFDFSKEIRNGLYTIKITSPDTLTYEYGGVKGDYPPRWKLYFMDSFGWYLKCQINTNEKLRNTVIRVLSKELQDRADLLTTMAQKTVRQRTALALILLDDIYKGAPINLSRDDLANFVGTATETVIRLLREFKKDAVIETKGRKITIIEKDHLMSISEII